MFWTLVAALENPSDREFATEMYTNYHSLLIGVVKKYVHQSQDVEDIVEDTMISMLSYIEKLRTFDEKQLKAYLIIASKNNALRFIEKESKKAQAECPEESLDYVNSTQSVPERELLRRLSINDLRQAIRELSERDRLIFSMKYYQDMTDQEISNLLGMQYGTTRNRISHIRKHVAARLTELDNQ